MPAAKKSATKARETKKVKPVRCKNRECNHPFSFHKGGSSRCHVVGCHCGGWEGPPPPPPVEEAK